MADESVLYLGNRNYSSWSLRASLFLRQSGLDIPEIVIPLNTEAGRERLHHVSPSHRVPVLHHGDSVIWDSLAILAWLIEHAPASGLLPTEPQARDMAWSVIAEMHSGFLELRSALPMDLRNIHRDWEVPAQVREDISRIESIWVRCRNRFGGRGEYLFGSWCAADAMYAPVVSRFRTYGVQLEDSAAQYAESVWRLPDMQNLLALAQDEPWTIPLESLTAHGPRLS